MKLNDRQKEAVEYLGGPLLVLAGPGTGKTQLLSQKVAYILRETDTNPENILCLTFTETGASNMRERLKSLIGPAGAKVNIGTYHAFGQDILSQYKNYSDSYDRNLDSAIDEVKQFKIVKQIRDGLAGTDILHGDNVRDIISVISDAKSAGLTAEDLAVIAKQNMEDSESISRMISLMLDGLPKSGRYPTTLDEVYQPIYDVLKEFENTAPILKNVERSIAGLTRDLGVAIETAHEEEKIGALSGWKTAYFEKDEKGHYRLKDRVANKKLASVAVVMGRYQEYLKAEGLFDFDDMIQEAIRALEENDGFRATLSERYQYIMLDEFQDTNPAQFKIVKCLTDYDQPVIMAVGDDDQAIYEFQGALATNLKDFQEYYGAKVVALEENYRSSQEILDFSTAVIKQADDRFEPNKKLFAKNKKYQGLAASQIERREFLSSDMEFGYVAKRVAELVRAGVPQSEIAIISCKHKYFEPLLTYLKEYPEIKIAYERRDNLLEDERIKIMVGVFRTILTISAGRDVREEIFPVLMSDFFGVPQASILTVAIKARKEHRPVFEVMAESENEEIKAAVEFLAELAKACATESIDKMLWRLVEKAKIDALPEYEQFKFYENLASLKGKLKKHFGEKSILVADLIDMVDDYEAANMMISVNSPYRDADEAVQILTAHKSKGLEFEYVFMISVDHTAWGKGGGNNNLLTLPKNLTHIRHTGITDGEKLRVLYVAMTRAKSHLILTNSEADFNGKSAERLEYLEESVQKNPETDADEVVSPFLPTKKVTVDDGGASSLASEEALRRNLQNVKTWVKPYVENPNLRAIYAERVKDYRLAATTLTSFIDVIYAGPAEFFRQNILCVPREPDTDAILFGNLIHKVFEAVTNQGISDEEAIGFFLGALDAETTDGELKRRLGDVGPVALRAALPQFGEILRQGRAEVDLNKDGVVVAGAPLIGRLDHIVIDEEAKTIEIYDFKTSKYRPGGWRSHPSLYKYMLQLGFYKLLLNNSPNWRKYTVTRGHILFVSPDKDGEVHDKVYDFNDEDERELIELIGAVYGQITSLAFLDDPEMMIEPNKNASMKDINKFVELLLSK